MNDRTMPAPVPSLAAVPVLETARLRLRVHRPDDLGDSAAMWGDPIVTRHIGGRPFSVEESWWKILRYAGLWSLLGFGYWVLEEKASGRFAGEVGFADFKREMTPSLDGAPEAGWVLASWAHGVGFATEAMRAALEWSDAYVGPKTACIIDPGNAASIAVARKCGYREITRTTYKGSATILFRRGE
jgi:RimJ/RimL family protein N-acetyltransferase